MKVRYYHLPTVNSTNTWLKEHAHEFAHDEVTVISATAQTHGYGRYGRKWHSPEGKNLYLSLGFFSDAQAFSFCQLASLLLKEFLEGNGITAKIKWPNDLLVNDKKIVGILTERIEVNGKPFIVLGIGLNVNMTAEDLEKIPQKATSMALEGGKPFIVNEVKETFVELFAKRLEDGIHYAPSLWQKNLNWMVHQHVSIRTALKEIEGNVLSVTEEGSLVLEDDKGIIHTIQSGDVSL